MTPEEREELDLALGQPTVFDLEQEIDGLRHQLAGLDIELAETKQAVYGIGAVSIICLLYLIFR